MEIREPSTDDSDRIRDVAESSMTSAFRLSPQQIDGITDSEFGDERLTDALGDDAAVVLVAESTSDGDENTVVGFFWGSVDGDRGHVEWLFVDPEHRGQDIGTTLLETGVDRLREAGATDVRAYALQAATDGHQFFEQFGYEQTDERRVDIGDETLAQFVYSADSDGEPADEERSGGDG